MVLEVGDSISGFHPAGKANAGAARGRGSSDLPSSPLPVLCRRETVLQRGCFQGRWGLMLESGLGNRFQCKIFLQCNGCNQIRVKRRPIKLESKKKKKKFN